jgi:hypothetical protein
LSPREKQCEKGQERNSELLWRPKSIKGESRECHVIETKVPEFVSIRRDRSTASHIKDGQMSKD